LESLLKKKGHVVYCIDLPGFGDCPKPAKPYSIPEYAAFVHSYVTTHKLNRVICIGHSFGGRVALYLAKQFPDIIDALVLTGVPGYEPVPTIKVVVFRMLAKLGKAVIAHIPVPSIQQFARKVLYKLSGSWDYYHTTGVMRDTFKLVTRFPLAPLLGDIHQPTLLLWGEHDRLVPLRIAQKMEHVMPHASLVSVPGCTHALPVTHPEAFIQAIESWKGLRT
jgi:pimeloyl-ACP methyl ester carboxylesterase